MSDNCPICQTACDRMNADGKSFAYECPRCGNFILSHHNKADLQRTFINAKVNGEEDEKRAVLSHAICKMKKEDPWPTLKGDLIKAILKNPLPSINEQANNLIMWFAENTSPGEKSFVQPSTHQSIIGAKNPDGFAFILKHLFDHGLLDGELAEAMGAPGRAFAKLTFDGWEYYNQLKRGAIDSRKAFMAIESVPKEHTNEVHDTNNDGNTSMEWDVFICHASEDKGDFVEPLANALKKAGLKVWYDRFELKLGDSLRGKIDEGLANSRYGVVVLSSYFFKKEWPKTELDALVSRQNEKGEKVILPIWHGIGVEEVRKFSPILASKLAAQSSDSLESIVVQIQKVLNENSTREKPAKDKGGLAETEQTQQAQTPSEIELIEQFAEQLQNLVCIENCPKSAEAFNRWKIKLGDIINVDSFWKLADWLRYSDPALDDGTVWKEAKQLWVRANNITAEQADNYKVLGPVDDLRGLVSDLAGLLLRRAEIAKQRLKPKKSAGKEHLDDIFPKKIFPMYPFKSGLMAADDCLYFTTDHTDLEVLQKAGGGVKVPLTKEQLAIIDKTVGSKKMSDIKCFLTQKCNVQNITDLNWADILNHLSFWLTHQPLGKQKGSKNKDGKIGACGTEPEKPAGAGQGNKGQVKTDESTQNGVTTQDIEELLKLFRQLENLLNPALPTKDDSLWREAKKEAQEELSDQLRERSSTFSERPGLYVPPRKATKAEQRKVQEQIENRIAVIAEKKYCEKDQAYLEAVDTAKKTTADVLKRIDHLLECFGGALQRFRRTKDTWLVENFKEIRKLYDRMVKDNIKYSVRETIDALEALKLKYERQRPLYTQMQHQVRSSKENAKTDPLTWAFAWLRNHPHFYGLVCSSIFLIVFLVVGFFMPQWRQYCWWTAGIAFLVLLVSLLVLLRYKRSQ